MVILFIHSKKKKSQNLLALVNNFTFHMELVDFLLISSVFRIPHDYNVKIYQEEQELQAGYKTHQYRK